VIIRKQNGESIEISTDCSVIDKLVLYKEFEDGELALVEMKDEGREVIHEGNDSVLYARNLASRLVDDEWDDMEQDTPLFDVLAYFERRMKDEESEYRVVFDSENLPNWFEQMLDMGDLKATKLYKFLIEIGMK
jgi:hypothetical protein